MSKRKPFRDLTKDWSAERKKRVADKTAELSREITLAELRNELGITQEGMAEALGRSQGAVSQLEKRSDMTLSNLRRVIEAMGGTLKISAEFPNKSVSLGIGSPPQQG